MDMVRRNRSCTLEVHNSSAGIRPQGIEQLKVQYEEPVPASLDWNRWLGPALFRPITKLTFRSSGEVNSILNGSGRYGLLQL